MEEAQEDDDCSVITAVRLTRRSERDTYLNRFEGPRQFGGQN